jgi:hypothetical protein
VDGEYLGRRNFFSLTRNKTACVHPLALNKADLKTCGRDKMQEIHSLCCKLPCSARESLDLSPYLKIPFL